MPCCCLNILELCRVSVCGSNPIKTGVAATATGEHQLVLDYLGIDVIIIQSFTIGDQLDFDSTGLNENYKYTGKIYKPDGTLMTLTVDTIEYTCLSFQTTQAFNAMGGDITPAPVDPCDCVGSGKLVVKVDGLPGSPVDGTFIFQHNDLIGAQVEDILVNKGIETAVDGDFIHDPLTGVITRVNQWFGFPTTTPIDTGIINFIKI